MSCPRAQSVGCHLATTVDPSVDELSVDDTTAVTLDAPIADEVPAVDEIPTGDEAPAGDETPSTDLAPVAAGVIEVTSPTEGGTLSSRTVTYTGTAPIGSSLTATTEYPLIGELALGPIPVDATGAFLFIIPFAPATENPVSVTFSGTDAAGVALESVTVSNDLPDPIAAPVITAPTSAAIVGTTVTFSGTGIAGNGIALVLIPTDEASAAALASIDPLSLATPIVVQADDTWTATYQLAFGNFAVTAIHTSDPSTSLIPQILSLASEPVTFSLVAPVVTPAAVPASTSGGTPVLAETGASQAGLFGPAALALLAGGALLVGARRRALQAITR